MPPIDPLASTAADRVIGRVINNYKVISALAEGGMGRVYLAEHPIIGRRAAIKVLLGTYAEDENMVSRFMNEARAANAIHHPNIVEIIDVGLLPGGPPYLMMEYLAGETLSQRLSRVGRLPAVDAVRILDQVASALEAAHAAGIIHRDLKPENLFLVPDNDLPGAERVKVVDFGIAKLLHGPLVSAGTVTGVVLGTPHYMSPEQCRGSGIDARTDIYALGVIAYQILCGERPFVADSAIDLMMMQIAKVPTRPSELFADIPRHLEEVTLRALAKNPDDRFASMSEFRRALQTKSVDPNGKVSWRQRLPSRSSTTDVSILRRRPATFWATIAITAAIAGGLVSLALLRGGKDKPTASSPGPIKTEPAPAAPAIPAEKARAAAAAPSPVPVGATKATGGTPATRAGKSKRATDKLSGGVHGAVPF